MRRSRGILSLALLMLGGCGPTIAESRLAFYRSRGDDCDLGFIQPDSAGKPLGDKWVVIRYVSVDGIGKGGDPLTNKNRELVRGRICQMGGTAVAVAVPGMSDTAFADADVTYAALRPAVQPAPEVAQKF